VSTTGNIADSGVSRANATDRTVDAESVALGLDDRERLRIIHELSKHIYEDTPKRNVRLLRQIHRYSGRTSHAD